MKNAVVITGASKGIGLQTVKILVHQGYYIYEVSRTYPQEFTSDMFVPVIGDLTRSDSVNTALDYIAKEVKKNNMNMSALINNAGYAQIGAVEDVPLDLVRKQFETNVFGLLEVTKKIIPLMKIQHSGKIINISSVVGYFTGPFGGVYSATKHALEALSSALRMELKRYGISVVVVNPRLTETNFHITAKKMSEGFAHNPDYQFWYDGHLEKHKRGVSPKVVARAISSIVSESHPHSRYIIGRKEKNVFLARRVLSDDMLYSMVEKTRLLKNLHGTIYLQLNNNGK